MSITVLKSFEGGHAVLVRDGRPAMTSTGYTKHLAIQPEIANLSENTKCLRRTYRPESGTEKKNEIPGGARCRNQGLLQKKNNKTIKTPEEVPVV